MTWKRPSDVPSLTGCAPFFYDFGPFSEIPSTIIRSYHSREGGQLEYTVPVSHLTYMCKEDSMPSHRRELHPCVRAEVSQWMW